VNLSAGVINHKSPGHAQPSRARHPLHLAIGKNMPIGAAFRLSHAPSRHHISISLAGPKHIVQESPSRPKEAILKRVISMVHINEQRSIGPQQSGKLAKHISSRAGRRNMPQNVPQTHNNVKLFLNALQLFSPHRPNFKAASAAFPHRRARLQLNQSFYPARPRDPGRPLAVTRTHVQ